MPNTTFFQMAFPEENKDPHYEDLVSFFGEIDSIMYALFALSQPLLGGGSVTLSSQGAVKRLSWTEDFKLPILSGGKTLSIKHGPSGDRHIDLVDGDRVVFDLFVSSGTDVEVNLYKLSGGLTVSSAQIPMIYTVGMLSGGKFYSKFASVIEA